MPLHSLADLSNIEVVDIPAVQTSLGGGVAGREVFSAASIPQAQIAIGIIKLTPAQYTALVSAGTTDPNTLYILTEDA
jgi:hypothetical protein